jgi:hypothetical protein
MPAMIFSQMLTSCETVEQDEAVSRLVNIYEIISVGLISFSDSLDNRWWITLSCFASILRSLGWVDPDKCHRQSCRTTSVSNSALTIISSLPL